VVLSVGDTDRPFYWRSAAKPWQATIAIEAGAGLTDEELAMASASHGGQPVHVALVEAMLGGGGASQDDLVCPPDWPLSPAAAHRVDRRQRIYHNCSGKHAALLRACAAQGWPLADYAELDHPLQQRSLDLLKEVSGMAVGTVGIDGCGFPVARTTVLGVATAFARLAVDERTRPVATAMHRFACLTSDAGTPEVAIATALDAVAKVGAAGLIGVALRGRLGLAVRCWDGNTAAAAVAAIACLDQLGLVHSGAQEALSSHARPPVLGGGKPVGSMEPAGFAGTRET